jgi:hypothetical protein
MLGMAMSSLLGVRSLAKSSGHGAPGASGRARCGLSVRANATVRERRRYDHRCPREQDKNVDLNELVNELLKQDIALIESELAQGRRDHMEDRNRHEQPAGHLIAQDALRVENQIKTPFGKGSTGGSFGADMERTHCSRKC